MPILTASARARSTFTGWPCSQRWYVEVETPSASARSAIVNPSRARRARTSGPLRSHFTREDYHGRGIFSRFSLAMSGAGPNHLAMSTRHRDQSGTEMPDDIDLYPGSVVIGGWCLIILGCGLTWCAAAAIARWAWGALS